MGGEWRQIRLGDIVEIFDGPHATPKKASAGPIFLGISSLSGGRIDLAEIEHLSEEDFARWTRRVTPSPGDVVFSYETRLGEVAMIPHGLRCCLGRRMGLLRAREGAVNPRFLLYAYLGPEFQETIRQLTIHGSTVDRIPLIDMPGFPITIPDAETQAAIANILGTLDDKIELNRQTNETLEAMARALFKSWFVDFDPVRAKADGRQPSGMDAETAKLFPSEFEESELGEIPKGWVVSAAGDVITLEYGRALKAEARRPGSVIVFGSNGVVGRHDEALAKGPGIVVGRKGNPGIVTWAPSDFFVIDTAFYVTRKADVLGWHFLRHSLELMDLARLAADSAVPGVNRNAIYAQPLLQPSAAVAQRFEDLLASFSVVVGSRNAESAVLGATRDTLLPRLLSGDLSVAGAERVLEAQA